jgi:site-specific recombinase XerD
MGKASWINGEGPLVPFANGLRHELQRRGYTSSGVKRHLIVMGQLNRWLMRHGRSVSDLSLTLASQFLTHRRAKRRRRVPTLRTLEPLFAYLRDQRLFPQEVSVEPTAVDELMARYREHLRRDRELSPTTVLRYQRMATRFLTHRAHEHGTTDIEGLSARDVTAHLLECSSRMVVTSVKREAADLRALLRFLHLKGYVTTDLAAAMPPVAGWRDTTLPPSLSHTQVGRLLDSCDRSTATGRRDFAILSLLARLGLRAGEVAALQLDDLAWRAGEITVRGKARREERLPLPVDVGEAIVPYLRDPRPPCEGRHLFLTRYPPFRGIAPATITSIVQRACQRAGLPPVGAHRLRHALAGEMLRQGGNLIEIGQVLRHRDVATTLLYAKVDLAALRTVAQPWPGGAR